MPSPEHEQIVEMVQSAPPGAGTLEESRAGFEAMQAMFPLADDVQISDANTGICPTEWVSVNGVQTSRVVLYLHGGGYVIGSHTGYREMGSRMARACQARALVIDYRLAPENPFPAAVEDATASYRWLLGQGVAASDIVVAGDSAGGGLTIATLVALRDAGDPMPSCAVAFSPWVDLEGTGKSAQPGAVDDPMVALPGLQDMAKHYAGDSNLRNPLAAPLYADLTGLPPLLAFVGTREILLDDAVRIVDNAQAAGVDAQLIVEDGLLHVWPMFANIPEAAKTLEQVGAFVAEVNAVSA